MFSLLMVGGILFLIMFKGLGFFWPADLVELELKSGERVLGRIVDKETYLLPGDADTAAKKERIQIKTGNRDLYGLDFRWIKLDEIESRTHPPNAIVIERTEWGDFYGYLIGIDGEGIEEGGDLWKRFEALLPKAHSIVDRIDHIKKDEIGDINYNIESLRLKIKGQRLEGETAKTRKAIDKYDSEIEKQEVLYRVKEKELSLLYEDLNRESVLLQTTDGRTKELPLGLVVRTYKPNEMGVFSKIRLYFSKVGEFLWDNPRESNTEGGVFPAIFGTVIMVIIMSIAVMPLGVLAALYLREYTKQGPIVRIVRICVNNLAGVPSIVF